MISKADRCGGGASLIAEDLALLLIDAGHRADHWLSSWGREPGANMRRLHGHGTTRLIRYLNYASRQLGLPELVPWEYPILHSHLRQYDIAHFHDISSAASPLTIRWVARHLPTVWTFHDCSPFTGGCLYPMACQAFHTRCHDCPQLDQWPLGGRLGLDFTGWLQSIKRRGAAEGRFTAVAPSRWMADEAMRSGMFAQRPRVIPNWVDGECFRPCARGPLRASLGLPPDRFCVLLSAGSLADPRKGTRFAVAALKKLDRKVSLLLVGKPDASVLDSLAGIEIHATGYLADPRTLALYYAAADVLLFPSLADNLPCTILETMASGTPTIGFRVGGVPDLIEHMVNGYLAEAEDIDGLVQGLERSIDEPETRLRWSDAGRRRADERHHRSVFVKAHVDLYREIREEFLARHGRARQPLTT